MPSYARIRYGDEIIEMSEYQFEQAVRDGKACRCGECLACAAHEHLKQLAAAIMRGRENG
jgi:hypothetical protein